MMWTTEEEVTADGCGAGTQEVLAALDRGEPVASIARWFKIGEHTRSTRHFVSRR